MSDTYAAINPTGHARMIRRAQANMLRRLKSLPPLPVETVCVRCTEGDHCGGALIITSRDHVTSCWCADERCSGGEPDLLPCGYCGVKADEPCKVDCPGRYRR